MDISSCRQLHLNRVLQFSASLPIVRLGLWEDLLCNQNCAAALRIPAGVIFAEADHASIMFSRFLVLELVPDPHSSFLGRVLRRCHKACFGINHAAPARGRDVQSPRKFLKAPPPVIACHLSWIV
jgi:hypothetical protein